jgi:hypothetical protein
MIPEKFEYSPIGIWLVHNKNCQNDDYFRGYATDIQLVKGTRVDVYGMHYDLDESCATTNHLSFTGHVVEVKLSQTAALQDVQKIRTHLDDINWMTREWKGGLNKINFYVAFVADQVSQEMLNQCKASGIGILRLQANDQEDVTIAEELPPVEVVIQGGIPHASQKSIGRFTDAMLDKEVFKAVMKVRPERIFEDLIRPKQDQYREKIAADHVFARIKTPEGRDALGYFRDRVQQAFPRLRMIPRGKPSYEDNISFYRPDDVDPILKLEAFSGGFTVYMEKTPRFQVTTKDDIMEFKQGIGEPYSGNLQQLLDSEILPWLDSQLRDT